MDRHVSAWLLHWAVKAAGWVLGSAGQRPSPLARSSHIVSRHSSAAGHTPPLASNAHQRRNGNTAAAWRRSGWNLKWPPPGEPRAPLPTAARPPLPLPPPLPAPLPGLPLPLIPAPYLCSMEEAYLAALESLGGLPEAKPSAVLELLVAAFPQLTLQAGCRVQSPARAVARPACSMHACLAPQTYNSARLASPYTMQAQSVKWHLLGHRLPRRAAPSPCPGAPAAGGAAPGDGTSGHCPTHQVVGGARRGLRGSGGSTGWPAGGAPQVAVCSAAC